MLLLTGLVNLNPSVQGDIILVVVIDLVLLQFLHMNRTRGGGIIGNLQSNQGMVVSSLLDPPTHLNCNQQIQNPCMKSSVAVVVLVSRNDGNATCPIKRPLILPKRINLWVVFLPPSYCQINLCAIFPRIFQEFRGWRTNSNLPRFLLCPQKSPLQEEEGRLLETRCFQALLKAATFGHHPSSDLFFTDVTKSPDSVC